MSANTQVPLYEVKRVLERHVAEDGYLQRLLDTPEETAQELGIDWDLRLIHPLLKSGQPLNELCQSYAERLAHLKNERDRIRLEGTPSHPRYRAWRDRQIRRANLELSQARNDTIIHAPAAFELAVGCSVGCWFCGISAGKLSQVFGYTPENARLWQGLLQAYQDLIGPALRWAFCYWGTDPLDNPDYERFCLDLWRLTGTFPQTTTALALKSPERTRGLLKLSQDHGVLCNRFSLLTLRQVKAVHQEFSPQELERTELIPQNKESILVKAQAGKARDKDDREPLADGATIACVSGLLVNMCTRQLRLVTPCAAGDRWPDGFQVRFTGSFADEGEFAELVGGWFAQLPLSVVELPVVRPGSGLQLRELEDGFAIGSPRQEVQVQDPNRRAYLRELAELLAQARHPASTIATLLSYTQAQPETKTLALLESLFENGALDEENHP